MLSQPDAPPPAVIVNPPVEPGYTTTEFWVSEATSAVTLVSALAADFGLGNLTGQQRTDVTLAAIFVIGLLQAGYALSRGIRKRGQ